MRQACFLVVCDTPGGRSGAFRPQCFPPWPLFCDPTKKHFPFATHSELGESHRMENEKIEKMSLTKPTRRRLLWIAAVLGTVLILAFQFWQYRKVADLEYFASNLIQNQTAQWDKNIRVENRLYFLENRIKALEESPPVEGDDLDRYFERLDRIKEYHREN